MTTQSPKRRTRQQEKEELQHLNDRFITYIDRVRKIREENESKDRELSHFKDDADEEASKVKSVYETELQDARTLIDETAKEKARYQILASKHLERVEELERDLNGAQKDNDLLRKDLNDAQEQRGFLESRLNSTLVEKRALQKRIKELEEEVDELQSQANGLRSQANELRESLEKETLSKVDLQNQNQSFKEELAFKKKVYEEELSVLRRRSPFLGKHGELDDDFADRLQAAIDEAREEIERETEQHRRDLEESYKRKLAALENQCSRDNASLARCNHELRKANEARVKANQANSRLQDANECLEAELRHKEDLFVKLRHEHSEELARLDEEHRLQREADLEKLKGYEELLDLRVQLEQEIKTLSALLHEEEMRLNLAPTPTREKRIRPRAPDDTTSPIGKRSKFAHELSASSKADGYIQIYDVDPDGRYIQIKNTSDKTEPLGGFKIVHEVLEGDEGINEYLFPKKSRLHGGAVVTVWGRSADGAVNSPTDIIWRTRALWGSGPKTNTTLITKTGKAVATFTQRKEISYTESTKASTSRISSTSTSQQMMEMEESDAGIRTFPRIPSTPPKRVHATPTQEEQPPVQVGDEQVFHQQGDPPPPPPPPPRDERCTIS